MSVCVLSDDWNGPWVQVDGDAEVLHMPEAEDALVEYFRCISGEHPDWDEYRAAMRLQNKSLIRVTPTRWGPIATGGFPEDVAARLDAELSRLSNGRLRGLDGELTAPAQLACDTVDMLKSGTRIGGIAVRLK